MKVIHVFFSCSISVCSIHAIIYVDFYNACNDNNFFFQFVLNKKNVYSLIPALVFFLVWHLLGILFRSDIYILVFVLFLIYARSRLSIECTVRACARHIECNGHIVSKCMKMWANLWYFLFWIYFISSPHAT